jgi:FtsH-binding integral membrane protein
MRLLKCHYWATGLVFVTLPLLSTAAASAAPATPSPKVVAVVAATSATTNSLETAASRASDLGRTVAFSLIGLALAVSAVVLVFRRDFKEAIGLLVIGVIAVLLASPVGVNVLRDTVSTLFGSG